jgi:hypothetical protein
MFEWDERKRHSNLRKHGIDFRRIVGAFKSEQRVVFKDDRRDYREARFIVLCPVNGILLHIAFTTRGDAIRIISARRANRREQRTYERYKPH